MCQIQLTRQQPINRNMASHPTTFLVLGLTVLQFLGPASSIQNEPKKYFPEGSEVFLSNRDHFSSTRKESSTRLNLDRTALPELAEVQNEYEGAMQDLGPREPEELDSLSPSKYVEHISENNIEVKPGEYYPKITPTIIKSSGEVEGAPQGQNLSSEPQSRRSERPQPEQPRQARGESRGKTSKGASASEQRQANPDIQDILTGIVKLLNGKVNGNSPHHRPVQATRYGEIKRINNRGPPRIPDVPPSIAPEMSPPPLPSAPHTYEKPPAPSAPSINQLPPKRPPFGGITLPEQIVPYPGHGRPWQRPRPNVSRPPIISYKPLDPPYQKEKDKPEEKVPEVQPEPAKPESNLTVTGNETKKISPVSDDKNKTYQGPLNLNNVLTENTLILGTSSPQTYPIGPIVDRNDTNLDETEEVEPPKMAESKPSEVPSEVSSTESSTLVTPSSTSKILQTLKIDTSSSVNVIEPTRVVVEQEPTVIPLENSFHEPSTMTFTRTALLEPTSKSEYTTVNTATPTETLPATFIKTTDTSHKVSNQFASSSASMFPKDHNRYQYRPRPGIVLDDTLDYTGPQQMPTQRPFVTPPKYQHHGGETFDVVVSASHGPGSGEVVKVPANAVNGDVLTSAMQGQGFVSIDGKRTYLNLFDNTERINPTKSQIQPTRMPPVGTGFAVAQSDNSVGIPTVPSGPVRKPPFVRRPTQPPVRIDTCIVGDTSTCDASQHEACATIQGVSACHCKPGFARLQHNLPCKRIVSIVVSMRVDKMYDRKIVWDRALEDKDSEAHQALSYEANKAVESAMSMTPYSDEYVNSVINDIYEGDISKGQGGVFVNVTLKLSYEQRTARSSLASELQKHLLGVINRRNNNIGNSALHVDSPVGSVTNIQDLDECASSELNDCHSAAICTNTWGGFTCSCKPGFKDPHKNDPSDSGRSCLSCPSSHCTNRGTCSYQNDQMYCTCKGNYYGSQCEIDGEVLGVAIGASVAAFIIIVLTLVCLVMWSRKWSREQKCLTSPVYGYMQGGIPGTLPGTLSSTKQGPPGNIPPYMYPHLAEHVATANVYATEPLGPTRPSSAMFGYHPTLSMHGTLPPVPLPRLQAPPRTRQRPIQHQPQYDQDSSDSELQDKDRADLIPQSNAFHVPRPKSRSSLANQSGIYYDVEYDQGDSHHLSKNNIPLSTYSMARPYYRT